MANGKVYDDVEVHDMNDMHRDRRSVKTGDEQNSAPVVWKALSVLIALLAVVYDLSPIDAVPDTIPLFGWLDDVGFTVMGTQRLSAICQRSKFHGRSLGEVCQVDDGGFYCACWCCCWRSYNGDNRTRYALII